MLQTKRIGVCFLVLTIMVTAMAVVYAKHENRKAFAQLQSLLSKRDDMEVHWGKLQLEQGAWTTHGRVEKIASTRLGMESPSTVQVVVVKP
jgi:cell division protein FtsL